MALLPMKHSKLSTRNIEADIKRTAKNKENERVKRNEMTYRQNPTPTPQTFVFQCLSIFCRSAGNRKNDKIIVIQTGDKVLCRREEPQVIRGTFRKNQCYFIFSHHRLFGGLCFGNVSNTAQGHLCRKGQPGAPPESAICLLLKNNTEIFNWLTLKRKKWLMFYNTDLEIITSKSGIFKGYRAWMSFCHRL